MIFFFFREEMPTDQTSKGDVLPLGMNLEKIDRIPRTNERVISVG